MVFKMWEYQSWLSVESPALINKFQKEHRKKNSYLNLEITEYIYRFRKQEKDAIRERNGTKL